MIGKTVIMVLFVLSVQVEASFSQYPVINDIEGNEYEVLSINGQYWLRQNLKVTKYQDGTVIPQFLTADNTAWAALSTGGWAVYRDTMSYGNSYGYLYNWFAVADAKGICPIGWRVSSDDDFKTLELFAGMPPEDIDITGALRGNDESIGSKLRGTSVLGNPSWTDNVVSQTNTDDYGFSWYGGGMKAATGVWYTNNLYKEYGGLWTTLENNATTAFRRSVNVLANASFPTNFNAYGIARATSNKNVGHCVRCVADAIAEIDNSAGFRMLSSPVETTLVTLLDQLWTQGATGADTENGTSNVWTWSNLTQSWVEVTDLTVTIGAGTGVLVYVYNDADFDGEANDKSRALAVSGTLNSSDVNPTLATGASDLTLVGNPYNKTLDFDNFAKTNMSDVVYVWDSSTSNWKTYGADKLGGYGDLTDGLIAPFQSYFVQNSATSPSLTISLTDTSATAGTFLGKVEAKSDFIRLELNGTNLTSSTWLVFNEEGTLNSITTKDAYKLNSYNATYAQLATHKGQTLLDIAHFPITNEAYSIPLSISATTSGMFALNVTRFQIAEGITLMFNDHAKGISIPVTENFIYQVELNKVANQKSENPLKNPLIASSDSEIRYSITVKTGTITSNEPNVELPVSVYLAQNFPNPFNPSTQIHYSVSSQTHVRLAVFDMLGREVAILLDGEKPAGNYSVNFEASNLTSGMYMYRLEANGTVLTKKMTLIK